MQPLSTSELLAVWEAGQARRPDQQALLLLAAACPDTSPDALARLSVGERDARLLTLREWAFGAEVTSLTACPTCGERVELVFNVREIRAEPESTPAGEFFLDVAGYEVQCRLPNNQDLAAIAESGDAGIARHRLLEQCVLAARHDGQERGTEQLPGDVVEAIAARMAAADPQADVHLALSCPACGHRWRAAFDIVSFFWSEISAWASRVLGEVHTLASAYGWAEAEVLAMSPWRRQVYLGMVTG